MTAQLQPINLVAPGFKGLNIGRSGVVLDPAFATVAENALIDSTGRLAARGGYSSRTTSSEFGIAEFGLGEFSASADASTPAPVKTLWEYTKEDGSVEDIVAWDGGISKSILNPEGSDISGSVTDADGRWWFQNFNNKCIGFQDGRQPIAYTGSGNFAEIVESAGTNPTSKGGIGLCAFGRVWAVDADGQTIKYCTLLNETDWAGTGSGSIDMSSVWVDGTDEITALTTFNGMLVVFGKKHIVFWTDKAGSVLGLDPEDMGVVDVIIGTGCVSQWSIQAVGETDLMFLGPNGVQSIRRVLEGGSNAVQSLTRAIRTDLVQKLADLSSYEGIRSTYNPTHGFYLLTIPDQTTVPLVTGVTYCIDQRFPYQDADGYTQNVVTTWTLLPTAFLSRRDYSLVLGGPRGVELYGGAYTDAGTTFRFKYQSPWLDFGEDVADRLKILKRIGAILFSSSSENVLFKWGVDFRARSYSRIKTLGGDGNSEFGTAEFGLGEYSGELSLRIIKLPARAIGQYFRLGVESDISGPFALNQLELFTKIGRLA